VLAPRPRPSRGRGTGTYLDKVGQSADKMRCLSGGSCRAATANRAAMRAGCVWNPKHCYLTKPTSAGLIPSLNKRSSMSIKDRAARRTMMIVTHDMKLAAMCRTTSFSVASGFGSKHKGP